MSGLAVGLLLGATMAGAAGRRGVNTPRHAWFNEKEFQDKLKAMYEGRCDRCPAKFFEYGGDVKVATETTVDWGREYRPWGQTPKGYDYDEDWQGFIDWTPGTRPSKENCEESVKRFRQLDAQGISKATIKTGWIFRDRIQVTTQDGKRHHIPL